MPLTQRQREDFLRAAQIIRTLKIDDARVVQAMNRYSFDLAYHVENDSMVGLHDVATDIRNDIDNNTYADNTIHNMVYSLLVSHFV